VTKVRKTKIETELLKGLLDLDTFQELDSNKVFRPRSESMRVDLDTPHFSRPFSLILFPAHKKDLPVFGMRVYRWIRKKLPEM
jgi:hypothetical protein